MGNTMACMGKKKGIPIPTPEQIRAIRDKLGLNQTEAAAKVGVYPSVWSDWERGKRKPSRQSAILLDLLRRKKL
jgi:DNA-binding transcriptional regulator YiaG